jgi:hypothetical protein
MATRRGAPPLPNRSAGAEMWSTGFAYDLEVALLLLLCNISFSIYFI